MHLTMDKIWKSIHSLGRALKNLEEGKDLDSIKDLYHAKENAEEAIYIIKAKLESEIEELKSIDK